MLKSGVGIAMYQIIGIVLLFDLLLGKRWEWSVTLPITQKILQSWGGTVTFRDGQTLFDRGLVLEAEFEAPVMQIGRASCRERV